MQTIKYNHVYMHAHALMYLYMNSFRHAYMCIGTVHAHAPVQMYTHTNARMQTHMHVQACMHIHTHIHKL